MAGMRRSAQTRSAKTCRETVTGLGQSPKGGLGPPPGSDERDAELRAARVRRWIAGRDDRLRGDDDDEAAGHPVEVTVVQLGGRGGLRGVGG